MVALARGVGRYRARPGRPRGGKPADIIPGEEYARGGEVFVPGIEGFLHHQGLWEAARHVHQRPVIEPVIACANLMLPGQTLVAHTDVPEFRGRTRENTSPVLLIVMHQSGLFDHWRVRMATGISWFGRIEGGGLRWWPDGTDAPAQLHGVQDNTALVFDADSVFHGVDAVGSGAVAPALHPGSTLVALDDAGSTWALRDEAGVSGDRYSWADLRLSVSWKGYCFADEAERSTWRDHSDDLDYDAVMTTLIEDLRSQGLVGSEVARDADLGRLMVEHYVRYPSGRGGGVIGD
jgi:hypothetical protein